MMTYALQSITPLELPILLPTHRHPRLHPATLEAIRDRLLLQRAVLERSPADVGFPLLVAIEDIE